MSCSQLFLDHNWNNSVSVKCFVERHKTGQKHYSVHPCVCQLLDLHLELLPGREYPDNHKKVSKCVSNHLHVILIIYVQVCVFFWCYFIFLFLSLIFAPNLHKICIFTTNNNMTTTKNNLTHIKFNHSLFTTQNIKEIHQETQKL
jgi:hypothetical protein